ncbi:hypothetical protein SERLA73DRAFT_129221 [Serpula lacrymans var. lacrymans S7.3]|uniref:Uncharacterized protein n=2 Tax=Serpula lacrymans var. lacrymans TaxID=341189 RepID=F8PFN5_SERL3|nr:uncharacterized protein SERLADRAFT_376937 [Serpula lacrymans var. lacrymans S7.9]EGO05324.1 hypothetical protein SERLA73DRAFT_129221 [Serpula lacrymans var. lacrymans S7.3]EGO31177.1 hypothetical protein SERLADRAFT_376937 [Serpula lacrymans var. lacrymans S7.9]
MPSNQPMIASDRYNEPNYRGRRFPKLHGAGILHLRLLSCALASSRTYALTDEDIKFDIATLAQDPRLISLGLVGT